MFIAFGANRAAFGALIADYDANSLTTSSTPTSVTSLTDSVSGNDATTANSGLNGPDAYGLGTTGYSGVFNGHNYVYFDAGLQGLAAANLFALTGDHTVVVVYANSNVSGTFDSPIAGQANNAPGGNDFFMLQARNAGSGANGDPYLALAGNDQTSGPAAPVANRLTFALGSYDSTTTTVSLSWAYGANGSVSTVSQSIAAITSTDLDPFTIGYDPGEGSYGVLQVAEVLVFDNSFTATGAAAEIASVQAAYAVPEPSTYALMLLGFLGLGLTGLRRHRK